MSTYRPSKACCICGATLVVVVNKKTGVEFLGCSNFFETGCEYTESIPQDEVMRRVGAPILPGIEMEKRDD